jgi:hypothetical protein
MKGSGCDKKKCIKCLASLLGVVMIIVIEILAVSCVYACDIKSYYKTTFVVASVVTGLAMLQLAFGIARQNNEMLGAENSKPYGIIVDKKIINPQRGLFYCTNTEYRFYISEKTYFTVSEEVYRIYNIGDNFDSRSF